MKSYIESRFFWANQAEVPGIQGLFCLVALLLISSKYEVSLARVVTTILKGNEGLLSLKTLNQTQSNSTHIKYPPVKPENITKAIEPLSKSKNGKKSKEPSSRISLTFGNCLAYCRSFSDEVSQFSGIASGFGNVFHNLSLKVCKKISNRIPIVGYTTKNKDQKLLFLTSNPIAVAKIPARTLLGIIANNPDEAMAFGFANISLEIIHFLFLNITFRTLPC